jgi:hypothetical protein
MSSAAVIIWEPGPTLTVSRIAAPWPSRLAAGSSNRSPRACHDDPAARADDTILWFRIFVCSALSHPLLSPLKKLVDCDALN